jgi:alkanesulfonate monooxygenase SsuD/methylene tetrahydromethanopterin reductase-like flavin-dependent oxidoreductase (luciferase family)
VRCAERCGRRHRADQTWHGSVSGRSTHEINCAKSVATLDHISNGRVVFGIGLRWNVEEMANHGVDFQDRRKVARERVLAMKALWAQDEVSFEGQHVHLSPSWMWPKPVQPAGPPILIGGAAGPKLFKAIVDYADDWIPIGGRGLTAGVAQLRELAERPGATPPRFASPSTDRSSAAINWATSRASR